MAPWEGTLARRLAAAAPRFRYIDNRLALVALYAALNFGLALYFVRFGEQGDWRWWAALPQALEAENLYHHDPDLPFVWSPVAAWLMAGVVAVGYWAWAALHVAAVFLLRDWRLIGLTFLSWPFWQDVAEGNTLAFAFVAGALALRGSRPAALAYLAMCMLMPRPLQLPLAVWLLWRLPEIRLPFVGVLAAHTALVATSGYALDWVRSMTDFAASQQDRFVQSIGPPRWFGPGWLIVGIPLGIWLTIRGRLGLAGLAMSPYWVPIYLLVGLWDLVKSERPELTGTRSTKQTLTDKGRPNRAIRAPATR